MPEDFGIREVIVVASGCTDGTERAVVSLATADPRITLVREARRGGKTSALNLILQRYRGDILVFLNADARLYPGALGRLLEPFRDEHVGIACGCPVPEIRGEGPQGFLEDFLWGIHNRTLETLSALGAGNHCCDEFMAIRRGFVEALPADLINDGAYLGVLASQRGLSVRFCPAARVSIEVPRDLRGVAQQRRRILRGHEQIRQLLNQPPNTLEGLVMRRPGIVLRVIVAEIQKRPVHLLSLVLLALPLELWANLQARLESRRRAPFHPAWNPVE